MSEAKTRSPARVTVIYAVGVIVGAALLAPWVFLLLHPYLTDVPFRRVFDRVILIVALVGLWPLLRALGIRSWGELGYPRMAGWWRKVLIGLAMGIGSLAVAGGLLLGFGYRSFQSPTGLPLLNYLLTGIIVAIIEETFFRGGVQTALQRATNLPVGIGLASAVYSIVHFLKPKGAGIVDPNWLSGFEYLGQVLTRSWHAPGVAVGFVTLWLAGSILGLAFARTSALYLPMGIHAGWVFTLKTFGWLTDGASLVDNALVWPVLLLMLWLCWKKLRPAPP
jgi:membrane protease YdiL (CAAX protease family)